MCMPGLWILWHRNAACCLSWTPEQLVKYHSRRVWVCLHLTPRTQLVKTFHIFSHSEMEPLHWWCYLTHLVFTQLAHWNMHGLFCWLSPPRNCICFLRLMIDYPFFFATGCVCLCGKSFSDWMMWLIGEISLSELFICDSQFLAQNEHENSFASIW